MLGWYPGPSPCFQVMLYVHWYVCNDPSCWRESPCRVLYCYPCLEANSGPDLEFNPSENVPR